MAAQFAIGIDLGTTNSVLAYAALGTERPTIELLALPQFVAPATVESRTSLPSFLYLPGTAEEAASLQLPGHPALGYAVGEWARKQSADAPTRTVAAAKSWLAHRKVDRRQPLLPWNAPPEVEKVSPVEAAKRYLEHLVQAWNAAFPTVPLIEQQVVLTVPASFDASARELTREAALAAGLPAELVLLEEPQAAVYAWLEELGDRWRTQLKVGNTLLVCDVGGGTTDFTLINVAEQGGDLILERRAVGNHILVGGDNMDLALAHTLATEFAEKKITLDPWQAVSLWHACRGAKETLLAPSGPESYPVTVQGRGSRLIGRSVSVELTKERCASLLVDGFLPTCAATDQPTRRRTSGFQELGLPFESDTAITRHLAAFLSVNGPSVGTPVQPTHLLFNGGVFKAGPLRQRLLEVLAGWNPAGQPPTMLTGRSDELDNAVARGAAYYALTQQGHGIRIRGGTARSYYVGIETAGLAIPGAPRPLQALCVVPFGMEEGTACEVPSREIGLVVGEPAEFRFFSSAVRKEDRPGTLLTRWEGDELQETDALTATLPQAPNVDDDYVPVRFQSRITELGIFELWCVHPADDRRWKLEFSVREEEG